MIAFNENNPNLTQKNLSTLSVRDRILRTAMILFNEQGVHKTGIDKIIAEGQVAKMSFYKHFPSKSNLIAAYLQEKGRIRFERIRAHSVDKHKDAKKSLLGIFDALEEWIAEPDFNGCPFIKGLTDFSDKSDPAAQAEVENYFSNFEAFVLERLSGCVTPTRAKGVLPQVMTLIVGAIVMGVATKDPKVARAARKAAERILTE